MCRGCFKLQWNFPFTGTYLHSAASSISGQFWKTFSNHKYSLHIPLHKFNRQPSSFSYYSTFVHWTAENKHRLTSVSVSTVYERLFGGRGWLKAVCPGLLVRQNVEIPPKHQHGIATPCWRPTKLSGNLFGYWAPLFIGLKMLSLITGCRSFSFDCC